MIIFILSLSHQDLFLAAFLFLQPWCGRWASPRFQTAPCHPPLAATGAALVCLAIQQRTPIPVGAAAAAALCPLPPPLLLPPSPPSSCKLCQALTKQPPAAATLTWTWQAIHSNSFPACTPSAHSSLPQRLTRAAQGGPSRHVLDQQRELPLLEVPEAASLCHVSTLAQALFSASHRRPRSNHTCKKRVVGGRAALTQYFLQQTLQAHSVLGPPQPGCASRRA